MPKLTKIYTRTGDDGSTGLGSGTRVPKTSPRIEAYGTVDELNAQIGVALSMLIADRLVDPLQQVQNELFHAGADLCRPEEEKDANTGPSVEARHVQGLEALIDDLSRELQPLENFVLPGGTLAAAQLHVARTVCRRAERDVARLAEVEKVGEHVGVYLNRLSDALFVMARFENKIAGESEPLWDSRT